uniref:Uncharacterized protein n=1 Tax=viral metagenome TaxID=1070528 RepID=A0A6C0EVN5_9ZZZZ
MNKFDMPIELSKIIQNFARPLTRIKWRQGGSFNSRLFLEGLYIEYDDIFYHIIRLQEVLIPLTIYEKALFLREFV